MARAFNAVQVVVGVLLLASPCLSQVADAAPASYSLSWVRAEGAEQCPSPRALVAEVELRLGRKVFEAAAERSFEVEVTRLGERFRSDVYLRDGSGRALGHRALQSDGADCAALANATALAIALLIDPTAAAREPPQGVAAFEPPPSDVAPPAAVVSTASPQEPAPKAAAVVAIPAPRPPPERPSLLVSLRGELALGVVPDPAPGIGMAFRLQHRSRWGVELGAAYTLPQNATQGSASLEVGVTRADALLTLAVGEGAAARWVLGVGPSLGAFHLAVREPAPVTAPGDYWFAAAQLMTSLQVAVTKEFFLEARASGLAALKRQAFLVRGQAEPVFRQAAVSGVLAGGVGVHFQ